MRFVWKKVQPLLIQWEQFVWHQCKLATKESWCGSWPEGPCIVAAIDNTHGLQKSCGEKGTAWPLCKCERARGPERDQESPTPAWTGFYCFSGHITLRMVLIYYAQVHCRWLPFTDNQGQKAAKYFKEKDVTAQAGKVVELVTLHTWVV